MKEARNRLEHLNNNCIEADWTLSLCSENDISVISIYQSRLRHLMTVQYETILYYH
jgi:hypothetical protein